MTDSSIDIQLAEILEGYTKEVKEEARKALEEVAKDTAASLKATSPKRVRGRKHYASGWRVKKDAHELIVYNATKPQLTYLLERGHAIANQYGSYPGRTAAQPHIQPARDRAEQEALRAVEERLNNL